MLSVDLLLSADELSEECDELHEQWHELSR